jgi:hypothetical protein
MKRKEGEVGRPPLAGKRNPNKEGRKFGQAFEEYKRD